MSGAPAAREHGGRAEGNKSKRGGLRGRGGGGDGEGIELVACVVRSRVGGEAGIEFTEVACDVDEAGGNRRADERVAGGNEDRPAEGAIGDGKRVVGRDDGAGRGERDVRESPDEALDVGVIDAGLEFGHREGRGRRDRVARGNQRRGERRARAVFKFEETTERAAQTGDVDDVADMRGVGGRGKPEDFGCAGGVLNLEAFAGGRSGKRNDVGDDDVADGIGSPEHSLGAGDRVGRSGDSDSADTRNGECEHRRGF